MSTFEPGLADDDGRGLLRDGVADLGALRDESGARPVTRPALERAGDHIRLPGQRALHRLLRVPELEPDAEFPKLLDQRAVLLVRKPGRNRLGAVGADPVDLLDVLLPRSEQAVDRPEMPGEVLRGDPAHVGDVETRQNAREGDVLGGGDRIDGVASRDLRVAVELRQLLRVSR